jgi:serine/threonine protein kinase
MLYGERALQPGQVIADRYLLEEPIGRGAMGAVWRALHLRLESPLAIKFLNPAIADEPAMLERFLREARSAAAVRSSHVVQIFDYGVDDGAAYIVMELLVGEPLDARLAARGRLAPPELDKIFDEVARAVSVAHELGVVHRDIKPANIFIAREGGRELTKVLDFGIAKLLDRRLEAPVGSGTNTGILLGTPNYMSPEQARGERAVDHRSDLWALAVLAFECLTGRHPFESGSLGDLVVKICTAEPLVPSQVAPVPPAFDAWFARGVDKDPAARFASAAEMAETLHALLSAEGLGADSRPRSAPARRLELMPSEGLSGTTERLPSQGLPRFAAESSFTASAVASEVQAKAATSRRRKIMLYAIPLALAAIGIALATSSTPERAASSPASSPAAPPSAASSAPSATTPAPVTRAPSPTGLTPHASPADPSAPAASAAPAPAAPAPRATASSTPAAPSAAAPSAAPQAPAAASPAAGATPRRPKKRPPSPPPASPAPAPSPQPSADPYADRL